MSSVIALGEVGTGKRAKVLIVDDEPMIRAALEDLLSDDFDVVTAADAHAALELISGEEIAVVLSDQRMPGLSGDQLLRMVRERSTATRVLITAYADLGDLVNAVNEGKIYAYVSKPWDPAALLETVRHAAEHFELSRVRLRRTRELGVLHRLVTTVSEAPTVAAAYTNTLEELALTSGWPVGEIWMRGGGRFVRIGHVSTNADFDVFAATAPPPFDEDPAAGIVGLAALGPEPVVVPDMRTVERCERCRAAREAGLGAVIGLPIGDTGSHVLLLFARLGVPKAEIDELAHFLAAVSAQLGAVLARRETAEALEGRERQYRLLADNATDMISVQDGQERFLYISPASTAITGYPPEDLVGYTPEEMLGEGASALRGAAGPVRFQITTAEGGLRWVESARRTVHDDEHGGEGEGEGDRKVGVTRDVSERVAVEDAARTQDRRFQALIENMSDAVKVLDGALIVRYVSPAAERMTGHPNTERLGRSTLSNVVEEDQERVERFLSGVVETPDGVGTATYGIRTASGQVCHVMVHAKNMLSDLAVGGLVLTIQDITERHEAQVRIERGLDRQERLALFGLTALESRASVTSLLQRAVREINGTLGADLVYVAEGRPGDGAARVLAAHGMSVGEERSTVPASEVIAGSAHEGGPTVVRFMPDGDIPLPPRPASQGFRYGIQVEVHVDGEPFGVLSCFWREVSAFDPGAQTFLSALANTLAARIDKARSADAFQQFFDISPDMFALIGLDGCFQRVNQAWEATLGWSSSDLVGRPFLELVHPDDVDRTIEETGRAGENDGSRSSENRYRCTDGSYRWLLWQSVTDPGAAVIYAVAHDVTELRTWTERAAQSQKLEAVGRLAAGVAHDFNNLLTVVLTNTGLLEAQFEEDGETGDIVAQIREAAVRGRSLTQSLLAFGRKQVAEPRGVDLNVVVRDMDGLLRRVLGDNVALRTETAEGVLPCLADPGQLDQVIMNLVVNARDAMPSGGTITLRTSVEEHTGGRDAAGAARGRYVVLSVSDTGTGIPAHVVERIFEPFFTTKDEGGTGLGLATCHGIVTAAGGDMTVETEEGTGSTFQVHLPWEHSEVPVAPEAPRPAARAVTSVGEGTLLIVDDNETVLRGATRVLQRAGYEVLSTTSPREALELAIERRDELALVLTDLAMPEMTGKELSDALAERAPKLHVLLSSGYADGMDDRPDLDNPRRSFLAKPYTATELIEKVRDIIERARSEGP